MSAYKIGTLDYFFLHLKGSLPVANLHVVVNIKFLVQCEFNSCSRKLIEQNYPHTYP